MYGLVNKAVEGLVVKQFGTQVWDQIRTRANLPRCPFLSLKAYPDGVTYQLVQAASEVLRLEPAQVLEAFGEHWVLFTASEGYGYLLEGCGQNMRDFLLNLDALHTRVALIFPTLQPPSFECLQEPDGSFRLRYYSHREGLAPMICGLLKGLAKRFETEVTVRQLSGKGKEALQAEFAIYFPAAQNGNA